MLKGLVAAVLAVGLFATPVNAQQLIDKFGPWSVVIFPQRALCAAHKTEMLDSGKVILQYIARGEKFTIQVKDPRFDYELGEEFGVVIETEKTQNYVRMKVVNTVQGYTFLNAESGVDKGIDLFIQLAQADEMTLRYKDDSYTYNLPYSQQVAASLLGCNEATVKK